MLRKIPLFGLVPGAGKAILGILFFWAISTLSIFLNFPNAEGNDFENCGENCEDVFQGFIWGKDSNDLYLTKLRKDQSLVVKIDLIANTKRTIYKGPLIISPTVNDCQDVFAPTLSAKEGNACIISMNTYDFHEVEGVKQIDVFPTWLRDCSEVVFNACAPDFCGLFLWNRFSNAVKRFAPFEEGTHEGTRLTYVYSRPLESYFPEKIIFGYKLNRQHLKERKIETHYGLGAIDLEKGSAWKIAELGNEWEMNRWFSSDTEDAIFFFKWTDSGRLDSLWSIRSDGSGMRRVMEGKEIGSMQSEHTIVSWSSSGKTFVVQYKSAGTARRMDRVDTLTGKVRDLGPKIGNTGSFALSPDGKKLAYVGSEKEIYILDLESGVENRISAIAKRTE